MDKFVNKWRELQPQSPILSSSSRTNVDKASEKRPQVEIDVSDEINVAKASEKRPRVEIDVSDDDIIGDPGKRKPIEMYPYAMRDSLRRRYLAKGPCQPVGHNFPQTFKSGKNRRFNPEWFTKYEWLEYGISEDKAYCLYCYLFASTVKSKNNKSGSKVFTEKGFNDYKDALFGFNKHEGVLGSSIHHDCRVMVSEFLNQKGNINHVLASRNVVMQDEYRIRLTSVVNVARFLLGEGLPFRGHDESVNSKHQGHFLGLINWYCGLHEDIRKVMLSNAPKNNQMTSPTIQRDIIECCAMETRKVILSELGDKYFSLLIDEARDSSVKEQMAIVVRFVNDNGLIVERFLGVVHVSETSAQCLKKAIDDFFAKKGLSLTRLRGQGYDGASNMRGEFNGLKALILNENKHAHYIHCFAHQLQLVVVTIAKEKSVVGLFFESLSMIVNTIGASCKRKDALIKLHHDEIEQKIKQDELRTGRGKNQEISLARPGDTRWGSHYKTLLRLFDMWNSVGAVLLSLSEDGSDLKIRYTAEGLIEKMYTFDFVFIAKFIMRILEMTNILSKALQDKNQDIANAVHMIGVVKMKLQKLREQGWDDLLKNVSKFCEEQNIEVPNMEANFPGRTKRLVDGVPKTNLHYFHVDIFLKVIDLVAMEFDNHFTEENTELLRCIMCFDPSNSFSKIDKEKLLHLAGLYSEDFTRVELLELDGQLDFFIDDVKLREDFSNLHDIGSLAQKMVEKNYHKRYPLVYRLLELVLVLPVGTASVERCFSAMNIVKTDLRNRLGDDVLSNSLLCYIEKEIFETIDNETIMQCFQKLASRRNILPPIASSASGRHK